MVSERRAFGERLRRQRERKRITLEAISQATKVPASLFASLERGDCSRWPAAIYARAYVRGYAEAVGLHVNDTVEDFAAAFYPPVLAAEDGETAPVRPPRGTLRLSLAEASRPLDLYRFCAEQTVTINTAAAGGNAALLAGLH